MHRNHASVERGSRGLVKRVCAVFGTFVISGGLLLAHGMPANAAPDDPFDPGPGQVWIVTNDTSQGYLFEGSQHPTEYEVVPTQDAPSGVRYNAMGFNENDRYLYGIKTSGSPYSLVRVGQGGVVTDLGLVSGLPNISPAAYYAGVFGDGASSDILYVTGNNGSTQHKRIYAVDIRTKQVVDSFAISTASGRTITDLIYSEGELWALASGGSSALIYRWDPSNGSQITIDASNAGIPGNSNWVGQWLYGNGDFGVLSLTSQMLYRFRIEDQTSAAPVVSLVAKSAVSTPTNAATGDAAASMGTPTDLGVTKTTAPTFRPGDTVTYNIEVHNFGPADSSGWVISDYMPAGLEDLATETPGCTIEDQLLTCLGGYLEVGESVQIEVTGVVPLIWDIHSQNEGSEHLGQALVNTVLVIGNEADPNSENDEAIEESWPKFPLESDLGIVKTGDVFYTPGKRITWNIAVTNYGPDIAEDWKVVDTLPAGLQDLATPTPGCEIDAGVMTCVGDPLPVGESRTFTVSALVPLSWSNDPAHAGKGITNWAQVIDEEEDPDLSNNEAESTSRQADTLANTGEAGAHALPEAALILLGLGACVVLRTMQRKQKVLNLR